MSRKLQKTAESAGRVSTEREEEFGGSRRSTKRLHKQCRRQLTLSRDRLRKP